MQLPTLTVSERAWLARHHGITVCIETKGAVKCLHRDGTHAWYAIDTLKSIIAGEGAA